MKTKRTILTGRSMDSGNELTFASKGTVVAKFHSGK